MPAVSRRTMRIYRRLDTWVIRPAQFVLFTVAALAVIYLILGAAIVGLAGK